MVTTHGAEAAPHDSCKVPETVPPLEPPPPPPVSVEAFERQEPPHHADIATPDSGSVRDPQVSGVPAPAHSKADVPRAAS